MLPQKYHSLEKTTKQQFIISHYLAKTIIKRGPAEL